MTLELSVGDINQAVAAIDEYIRTFSARGAKGVDVQVRASGDDIDVIKVWVDLGPASCDPHDWAHEAEAAIKKNVVPAAGFRVQVRAEKL